MPDDDQPKDSDFVISCGHPPDLYEAVSGELTLRFKLGIVHMMAPKWRVTCNACAAKSMNPRMVWHGQLGNARRGNFTTQGALF